MTPPRYAVITYRDATSNRGIATLRTNDLGEARDEVVRLRSALDMEDPRTIHPGAIHVRDTWTGTRIDIPVRTE